MQFSVLMKASKRSDRISLPTQLLKKYNQMCVELKWELTCWGANWYAELYASGLIADGDGWYFHAVKYVMKLDFSTDGIFSITLYSGKKKKPLKDNLVNLGDHTFIHALV